MATFPTQLDIISTLPPPHSRILFHNRFFGAALLAHFQFGFPGILPFNLGTLSTISFEGVGGVQAFRVQIHKTKANALALSLVSGDLIKEILFPKFNQILANQLSFFKQKVRLHFMVGEEVWVIGQEFLLFPEEMRDWITENLIHLDDLLASLVPPCSCMSLLFSFASLLSFPLVHSYFSLGIVPILPDQHLPLDAPVLQLPEMDPLYEHFPHAPDFFNP